MAETVPITLLTDSVVGRKRFYASGAFHSRPQVIETSCPIKGVMCTWKGMQLLHSSLVRIGYIRDKSI